MVIYIDGPDDYDDGDGRKREGTKKWRMEWREENSEYFMGEKLRMLCNPQSSRFC